jgi:hypothetical protein
VKSVGTALEAGNRGSPGLVEVLWHIQGYAEGYDRECKWPSTDRAGTKSRPLWGKVCRWIDLHFEWCR